MNVCAFDITGQFNIIFKFFNDVLNLMNSLEFTAFGFTFTYLGIFLSLIVLITFVSFLRFGFVNILDLGEGFDKYDTRVRKKGSFEKTKSESDSSKKLAGRMALRSKR